MLRCCRLINFNGRQFHNQFRGRLPSRTTTKVHSFVPICGYQTGDTDDDANERYEVYGKRLETKNLSKNAGTSDDERSAENLQQDFYRKTHTPEKSVLATDLVRKHKALRRDARRLRRMHREIPQKTQHLKNFKSRPFSHCDPSSDRMVQSIVHQLKKADKIEKEDEGMSIQPDQIVKLDESEKESLGSLEDLELSHGRPRPPRPMNSTNPMDLPLSRPNLEAFHQRVSENLMRLEIHFAEWFIGITEAQQAFKYDSNGRPYYALHHTDKQFFHKIRDRLHFGRADDIKEVFYVKNDKHLQHIIYILNGNLYLHESRENFKDWVESYRKRGVWNDEDFVIKKTCEWRPQLNNKWLMGWIDSSYGLFAGRLVEDGPFPHFRIQLKFWLLSSDRSLLEHMKDIFGGGWIENDGELYKWTIKERKHHVRLNRYCRMFKPLSQKNINVARYYRLVIYPIVKIKTERAWKKLNRLIENLNGDERKWAITIRCHPYYQCYKQNTEMQMELARKGAPIQEVKDFKKQREAKDFPLWKTNKSLTLIEEVD